MIRASDRILGPARGTAAKWIAIGTSRGVNRLGEFTSYVNTVYDLAPKVGIDPALAVSQSALETTNWTDAWWTNRLNPGGIGITGDPQDNAASKTFATGTESAQAQIVHLWLYTSYGDATPVALRDVIKVDPRASALIASGWAGTAVVLSDLNNKWAANANYGAEIAQRGNELYDSLPDQDNQTGGTPTVTTTPAPATGVVIAPPDTILDPIDVHARDQSLSCRGWDDLGTRPVPPKGLVLHRSINGPGQSNSGWYHETCCPALTDLEVIATTGVMRRFVAEGSNVSGWANGVVSAPYGDALAWLNLHAWDLNTVNRDWESCEITGEENDPVSDAAWHTLAQWIAWRANQYGIPWADFPLIKAEGSRSYITWHEEWTIGTGKRCPFDVVKNYTPTLIEQARAIMKAAQTGQTAPKPKPPTTVYADPIVPDWLTADLKLGYPTDHQWNGLQVFAALRPYTAFKTAKRLQTPDIAAKVVGPPLKVGETFRGFYRVVATDAKGTKRGFILTQFGTWVLDSALTPRISLKAA